MGRVRSGREINSALCQKGFRRETGGDHICYFLTDDNGNDTDIRTKVSHGVMGETIGVNLISRMARQLRLTKAQFLDLIDCSMDEATYRAILGEQDETV